MRFCVCLGLGLGYVVACQTPNTHIYTPNAPANIPARYLHIPGHGRNQNNTHNKSKHTMFEMHGVARMVWMGVVKRCATGGDKKRTWKCPNCQITRLFWSMGNPGKCQHREPHQKNSKKKNRQRTKSVSERYNTETTYIMIQGTGKSRGKHRKNHTRAFETTGQNYAQKRDKTNSIQISLQTYKRYKKTHHKTHNKHIYCQLMTG